MTSAENRKSEESKPSNPIGKDTCNLSVNVKLGFAEAAKEAAWRERKKLSVWLREAIQDRIDKTASEANQLKLAGLR